MLFYLYSILIAVFILFTLKRVAVPLRLLDRPCERKMHEGMIPLIGGIGVYFTIVVAFLSLNLSIPVSNMFFLCTGVIVFLGVLDDKYDLKVSVRLLVQIILSVVLITFEDRYISSLGAIFGELVPLEIGIIGIPLTVIAIIAAINAFNMIDGIDGLLACTASVTFLGILIMSFVVGDLTLVPFCALMLGALTVFLMFNLNIKPLSKTKIFMGDAGSMLIGLIVIWLLVIGSQPSQNSANLDVFSPVTALYFIAIPLMDLVAIMYRRIKKGSSPFKADRDHIHHIFMRMGATPRVTLCVISILSLSVMLLGVCLEAFGAPEWVSLIIFCFIFALYVHTIQHAFKFTSLVNKILKEKV